MKKLIFTLPLIFAVFSANAQNSDKFTGTLLWKVSGNGLEHPSYIFGTHHLAEVSFAQNYPGFADALENATQIVGEIDMSQMSAVQNAMMMHAALPAGTTYETLLSAKEHQRLDQLLRETLGAGLDQFGSLKPAMLNNVLAIKLMTEVMPGLNPMTHVSIDQYVQNQAKGRKVKGLETTDDQIQALFYADPLDVQAKLLLCALSNMEFSRKSVTSLNENYASGDLYRAYEMAFENPDDPCPMSEASALALCKIRNDKWIEQLPGIFADGQTFVAVGMLHLCGQEGILYLLDQLGYTIEAVK